MTIVLLSTLSSCTTVAVDAGYINLQLGGDIGFATGVQNVTGQASVDDGLGQGDRVGAPYGRVELVNDSGFFGAGLFASGFAYDNQGTGTLTASYGNIVAGTAVKSDFSLVNAKVGMFLHFDIADLVFIRPGIAADMFLPDLTVETTQITPTQSEKIDDPLGVPLPYVQVGVDTGIVSAFVEVGYLPLDTSKLNVGNDYDVDSKTLDVEAMVRVRPSSFFEIFAGYRLFKLQVQGRLQQDSVDIDIDLTGFMVGGGFYW
ncbi:MAG: hypothetical protein R3F56_22600 [Planctomycetota bacterium]